MTIKELVDAAARLDPNVQVTAYDQVYYEGGKPAKRVVTAQVTARGREGSPEDIVLEMDNRVALDGPRLSDHVKRVVPGQTTLYWQADPLIRAFDQLTTRPSE